MTNPEVASAERRSGGREGPFRSLLITGAGGYLGRLLVEALARERGPLETVLASDLRVPPEGERLPGIEYVAADVRSPDLAALMARAGTDVVVHLAAIVDPRGDRASQHSVDVLGARNVLDSCLGRGVRKLIVTSSGAAYGYHADNPAWLDEADPLRGNPELAYSDHKRQVEELLGLARREHPELRQLVLRPGTVLGRRTRNPITNIFDRAVVIGVRGASSPFVFVWDEDVVACLLLGVRHPERCGVFNLAGDGALGLREVAALLGKPYLPVPAWLLEAALRAARAVGASRLGPEHVRFLRFRPVLSNRRLKQELGFLPRKTSREALEVFLEARRGR